MRNAKQIYDAIYEQGILDSNFFPISEVVNESMVRRLMTTKQVMRNLTKPLAC
jgi:hypothetical protein